MPNPGDIILERSGNTYIQQHLPADGLYEITLIGGGGGGCGQGAKGSSYSAASGSAGGVFIAKIAIKAADTVAIIIGGGGNGAGGGDFTGKASWGNPSKFSINNTEIAVCNGGGPGETWFRGGSRCYPGGSCEVRSTSYNVYIIRAETGPTGTNGARPGYYFECQAPTNLGNYGKGGRAMGDSGGYRYEGQKGFDGYIRITYIEELATIDKVIVGTQVTESNVINVINSIKPVLMSYVRWTSTTPDSQLPGNASKLPRSILDSEYSITDVQYGSLKAANPNGFTAITFINNVIIPLSRILSKIRLVTYNEYQMNGDGSATLVYTQSATSILNATSTLNINAGKIVSKEQMNVASFFNSFIQELYNLLESNRVNNVYTYNYYIGHSNHSNHGNRGRR